MKSFHAWVSEMANTIEDTSTFVRETSITLNSVTKMQIRMLVADMLVPNPNDEDLVQDWVSAFCVCLVGSELGNRDVSQEYLKHIIGEESSREYLNTVGNTESCHWLIKFKNKIKEGKIK